MYGTSWSQPTEEPYPLAAKNLSALRGGPQQPRPGSAPNLGIADAGPANFGTDPGKTQKVVNLLQAAEDQKQAKSVSELQDRLGSLERQCSKIMAVITKLADSVDQQSSKMDRFENGIGKIDAGIEALAAAVQDMQAAAAVQPKQICLAEVACQTDHHLQLENMQTAHQAGCELGLHAGNTVNRTGRTSEHQQRLAASDSAACALAGSGKDLAVHARNAFHAAPYHPSSQLPDGERHTGQYAPAQITTHDAAQVGRNPNSDHQTYKTTAHDNAPAAAMQHTPQLGHAPASQPLAVRPQLVQGKLNFAQRQAASPPVPAHQPGSKLADPLCRLPATAATTASNKYAAPPGSASPVPSSAVNARGTSPIKQPWYSRRDSSSKLRRSSGSQQRASGPGVGSGSKVSDMPVNPAQQQTRITFQRGTTPKATPAQTGHGQQPAHMQQAGKLALPSQNQQPHTTVLKTTQKQQPSHKPQPDPGGAVSGAANNVHAKVYANPSAAMQKSSPTSGVSAGRQLNAVPTRGSGMVLRSKRSATASPEDPSSQMKVRKVEDKLCNATFSRPQNGMHHVRKAAAAAAATRPKAAVAGVKRTQSKGPADNALVLFDAAHGSAGGPGGAMGQPSGSPLSIDDDDIARQVAAQMARHRSKRLKQMAGSRTSSESFN